MPTERKNLSKREKRMLLIMVVFGLFAVMIIFVLVPFYYQFTDKTEQYNAAEMEKSKIVATLASEEALRDSHDAVLVRHKANSARFLNEALSNDIGRMLTQLCETYGLAPIDQKLSSPADFNIDGSGNTGEAGDPVFLIVSAVMTIRGEYDDIKALLDAVEKIDYIRISRLSFSRSTDLTDPVFSRISIYFEVTMLKNLTAE